MDRAGRDGRGLMGQVVQLFGSTRRSRRPKTPPASVLAPKPPPPSWLVAPEPEQLPRDPERARRGAAFCRAELAARRPVDLVPLDPDPIRDAALRRARAERRANASWPPNTRDLQGEPRTMTATQVDGIPVVEDEPTVAPITTNGGKPVLWQQTRTLLLEDGRIVYGCAHCDFVRDNANAIRPHLRAHADRPKAAANNGKPDAGSMTLDDLLARLGELAKVEAERDRWKAEALKAKRQLKALGDALKGVSLP